MNNPFLSEIVLIGGMVAIFWLIVFRPQQVQKRRHEEAILAIKKGDEIVTSGGIIGEIVHVRALGSDGAATMDDRITIKSGESRLVILRGRINQILSGSADTAAARGASTSGAST